MSDYEYLKQTFTGTYQVIQENKKRKEFLETADFDFSDRIESLNEARLWYNDKYSIVLHLDQKGNNGRHFIEDPYIKVYDNSNPNIALNNVRLYIAKGKERAIYTHDNKPNKRGIPGDLPLTNDITDMVTSAFNDISSYDKTRNVWDTIKNEIKKNIGKEPDLKDRPNLDDALSKLTLDSHGQIVGIKTRRK